jgi:hypothetical protein
MGAIAAVTNTLGGPPPPPVIVQSEPSSTGAEEASTAAEINDLPDVEVPPSDADLTDTSPDTPAEPPYPDLPPPPTTPPPPPPPAS